MVSGSLDYSDPAVQRDMEELVGRLENTTYIDPAYTESWLRSFMDYVTRWSDYPGGPELRVDTEQNFIRTLKDVSSGDTRRGGNLCSDNIFKRFSSPSK